jgi:hypothetical protein
MRATVISLISLLACIAPSLADEAILTQEQLKVLQQISADPKARQAALAIIQPKDGSSRTLAKAPAVITKAAPAPGANSTAPKPDAITTLLSKNENKPAAERQYSKCPGFNFLLRQNWADAGIIAGKECPDSVDKATGAQVSYTNDRVANNRIVAIDGTAALIYNSIIGNTPGQITPYETSFGVYTTVDQSTNSAVSKAKSNVDTLAYGGVLELGFTTNEGANYFRVRGGGVEDGIKDTTAGNVVFEWLPVYNPLSIHVPVIQPFGLPIITRFDPELVALFDETVGKNQVLAFNNRQQSLRLGPELALNFLPFPGLSDFQSRLNAKVAYDLFYEAYSGKFLSWFTSSLTFNIDKAGHLGLTGTYKRGPDINTGEWTNVYTIGLSGKI